MRSPIPPKPGRTIFLSSFGLSSKVTTEAVEKGSFREPPRSGVLVQPLIDFVDKRLDFFVSVPYRIGAGSDKTWAIGQEENPVRRCPNQDLLASLYHTHVFWGILAAALLHNKKEIYPDIYSTAFLI